MKKPKRSAAGMYSGFPCPEDPDHGSLVDLPGTDWLYCPHQKHAVAGGHMFFTYEAARAAADQLRTAR